MLAVAGETISNVVRHSKATVAVVAIGSTAGSGPGWELRIEDNGVGFDPDRAVRLGHQGLANTRDRVAQIGGTVTIDSRAGAGTLVVVRVPAAGAARRSGED